MRYYSARDVRIVIDGEELRPDSIGELFESTVARELDSKRSYSFTCEITSSPWERVLDPDQGDDIGRSLA